jgi:hypothetical protein
LAGADVALDAQSKSNADAISTNATNISSNDTDISTNATNISSNDTDISGLQTEVTASQTAAGLNADGTYAQPSGTNYLDATTTLAGADVALDAQSKSNADAISTNATNIAANDYFDQTGVKLAAGTGETWTELETAVGTFTTSASAGTLTIAAGSITDSNGAVDFGDENLSTTGTLGAGATTLGSTLDVTGAGEFDSTLGADGNLRVGTSGSSKFTVDAASGAITTSGDLAMTNGTIVAGALQVSGATTLNTADVSTMSVSTTLTVPTPSFGAAAANKSYVDSHPATLPQAFSYVTDGTYTSLGADLSGTAVTITVTGANLAAGTYKLHLDGNEMTLTATVNSTSEIEFDLTDTDVSGMFDAGRVTTTGLFATQLSIDGIATGLTIFVNL